MFLSSIPLLQDFEVYVYADDIAFLHRMMIYIYFINHYKIIHALLKLGWRTYICLVLCPIQWRIPAVEFGQEAGGFSYN